ncbi:MAG TPA: GNAT family N-acetyltransferase [Terracidiphilus sp.]
MICRCDDRDFEQIFAVIVDGASAYTGIVPADRWSEPDMSREKLQRQIDEGVLFWGYEKDGAIAGVMGLQQVDDVTLIRHTYVRMADQNQGIGSCLLHHLRSVTANPVLVGTWADATRAIRFYEKHGFRAVDSGQRDSLLKRYWTIPACQIEASVVLADRRGWELHGKS